MKLKYILLFLLLFGAIGYFREFFMENLNIVMAGVYRNTNEYANVNRPMPAVMLPFSKLSYATLYYLKYPLTLFWTAVFYFVSLLALKRLAANKSIVKYLTIAYVALLAISALSMAIGYAISGTLKNDEYTLSRALFGIAQSPIICLILLASEKLYSKTTSYDN